MTRAELSCRRTLIRYDGAPPTTETEKASNKYPKRKPGLHEIADTDVSQWSEVFDNKT